jgi:hypothetical protein
MPVSNKPPWRHSHGDKNDHMAAKTSVIRKIGNDAWVLFLKVLHRVMSDFENCKCKNQ